MKNEEFSPCRSKENTKPRVMCPDVTFYYCKNCSNLEFKIYTKSNYIPSCCGEHMKELSPNISEDIKDRINIDYKIIGGYNSNAVRVYWDTKNNDLNIIFVYLKTFTGGQIKYLNSSKKSVIFALADEDAYVYCDENPCLECTFRCKRGFEIYLFEEKMGLIKVPLDRMNSNW